MLMWGPSGAQPLGAGRDRLAAALFAVTVCHAAAAAAEAKRTFSIPAGPATETMARFASDAGVNVIAAPGLLERTATQAVEGEMSPQEALQRMLDGAGVRARYAAPGAVVVTLAEERSAAKTKDDISFGGKSSVNVNEIVVVTAARRPTDIFKTPISVTAFGSEEFVNNWGDAYADLSGSAPGVSVVEAAPGRGDILIRGVSSLSGVGEPTVGVYVNDTPVSVQGLQTAFDFVDLQRVEVLRGPQGVNYGEGALAGAVRLISHPAEIGVRQSRQSVEYLANDFDASGGGGDMMFNIPLSERNAVRIVAYARRRPDFFEGAGGLERFGARGAFRREGEAGSALDIMVWGQDATLDGSALSPSPNGNGPAAAGFNEVFSDAFFLASASATTSMGGGGLTFSASYFEKDAHLSERSIVGGQVDDVAQSTLSYETQRMTAELRFDSRAFDVFSWNAGVFFNEERDEADLGLIVAQNGDAFTSLSLTDRTTAAVFGGVRAAYDSGLELEAGLRVSSEQADFGGEGALIVGDQTFFRGAADDLCETLTTFRVSAGRPVGDQLYLYSAIADGVRSGGFNLLADEGQPATFDADRIRSYEAGVRWRNPDMGLSASAIAFRLDWDDVQVDQFDDAELTSFLANAGEAKSEGVEVEARWRPIDGLTLTGAATALRARFEDGAGVFTEGERLPNTPERTYAVSAEYRRPLGAGDAQVSLSYRHVGESVLTGLQINQERQPAYGLLNVRTRYAVGGLEGSFFIDNATDERAVLLSALQTRGGVFFDTPRTFGISLTARY